MRNIGMLVFHSKKPAFDSADAAELPADDGVIRKIKLLPFY